MTLFNDYLKKITLNELLIVIIILFLIQYSVNSLTSFNMSSVWVYTLIILFFIFKLKSNLIFIKNDFRQLFTFKTINDIMYIILLNIFLSYLCLYIADFILLDYLSINTIFESALTTTVFSTIIISPIAEELIFRGVFVNRLRLIVPLFSSLILSSLFFASLHSFGSLFSSFIFALCMSILYIGSENILIPITAHFLNNLIAEIIVHVDKSNIIFTNTSIILLMSILGILSLILILIWIVKQLNTIKD